MGTPVTKVLLPCVCCSCFLGDGYTSYKGSFTVRPGLKGSPSSRPFRVILIGLRKISRNFSIFHILTSQQFLETVSRFFAQTVRSYVCNIVLHPLLMAYVVEICDNYADLSRKVLLPMYNAHHEFGPIPSKNRYMA